MNIQDLINEGVESFANKEFDEAIAKLDQALGEIEDKNRQIQEQIEIQSGLGRCYFEQAKQAKGKESEQLFRRAVEHFQQQLSLTKQLTNQQNRLQKQLYSRSWLGGCYLGQAEKAKGKKSEELFGQAVKHFQQYLKLAKQLTDEQNSLQKQNKAQSWLGPLLFRAGEASRRQGSG